MCWLSFFLSLFPKHFIRNWNAIVLHNHLNLKWKLNAAIECGKMNKISMILTHLLNYLTLSFFFELLQITRCLSNGREVIFSKYVVYNCLQHTMEINWNRSFPYQEYWFYHTKIDHHHFYVLFAPMNTVTSHWAALWNASSRSDCAHVPIRLCNNYNVVFSSNTSTMCVFFYISNYLESISIMSTLPAAKTTATW